MVMLKELFDDAMKNINQPKRGRRIPSQKTGVRNVYLMNCPRCKNGFMFQYRFMDEKGERRTMQSINFNTLENKVKEKKMEWIVDDAPLVRKTLDKIKRNEL